MKKAVLVGLTIMFLGASFISYKNVTSKSQSMSVRMTLNQLAYAQTSDPEDDDGCTDGTCTENDCPWWDFSCDTYSNSDAESYWESCGLFCSCFVTDCYPGTGSCTPSISTYCDEI